MRTRRFILSTIIAASFSVAASASLSAQAQENEVTVVELESETREAINNPDLVQFLSGRFKVVGRSYQVRAVNGGVARGSVSATRPVYSFLLNGAAGQGSEVVQASLTFQHPEISIFGPDGDEALDASETMAFFSVEETTSSDINRLPGPSNSVASDIALATKIFDDLGDGTEYGTLTASKAQNGTTQTVFLNAQAVAAINAAISNGQQEFLIGGSLTSGRTPGNGLPQGVQERIFRGADDSGDFGYPEIKLRLSFGGPLPKPAPAPALGGVLGLSLLGTGLGGAGIFGMRRRRK